MPNQHHVTQFEMLYEEREIGEEGDSGLNPLQSHSLPLQSLQNHVTMCLLLVSLFMQVRAPEA